MNQRSASLSDAVKQQGSAEQRAREARMTILKTALPTGVKVSFGEGRRAADVAMVLLKGERAQVLKLPTLLEDQLGLHVHVVRSAFAGSNFELLLVFTEPLEGQALRSPERRAALKQQLRRLERDGAQDADLLDTDPLDTDPLELDGADIDLPDAGQARAD